MSQHIATDQRVDLFLITVRLRQNDDRSPNDWAVNLYPHRKNVAVLRHRDTQKYPDDIVMDDIEVSFRFHKHIELLEGKITYFDFEHFQAAHLMFCVDSSLRDDVDNFAKVSAAMELKAKQYIADDIDSNYKYYLALKSFCKNSLAHVKPLELDYGKTVDYKGFTLRRLKKDEGGFIVWSYNGSWMDCGFDNIQTATDFIDAFSSIMSGPEFHEIVRKARALAIRNHEITNGCVTQQILDTVISLFS